MASVPPSAYPTPAVALVLVVVSLTPPAGRPPSWQVEQLKLLASIYLSIYLDPAGRRALRPFYYMYHRGRRPQAHSQADCWAVTRLVPARRCHLPRR